MSTGNAIKRPIERPIAGFVLSLLGGLFITAGGVYNLLNPVRYFYSPYDLYQTYGVVGVITGVGLLVGAALIYTVPRHRVAWGIAVLVFGVASMFSLFGALAGLLFVGMPLALVGGSFAIAWKPSSILGFEDYRTCLACGRHVRVEYPVCPFCGTPTPQVPQGAAASPPLP